MMESISSDEVEPLFEYPFGDSHSHSHSHSHSNRPRKIRSCWKTFNQEYTKADVVLISLTIAGMFITLLGFLFILKVFPFKLNDSGIQSITGIFTFIFGLFCILVGISILGERWFPSKSNCCCSDKCRR